MAYPYTRMRRSRQQDWTRSLVAEHQLSVKNLIWPIFVHEHKHDIEIDGFYGVMRYSVEGMVRAVEKACQLGVPAVALFPVVDPSLKTNNGEEATNPENLICRCVKAIKSRSLPIGIIVDVALDPYTSHGHDGILVDGLVDNDRTVEQLVLQALVLAESGADVIAPSDMMDGRIRAIRQVLEDNNYAQTLVMSYAAKYASSFYSPFRSAVGSAGAFGKSDKKTYQQDFANIREAVKEVQLDLDEGADWVMVKPAMSYLDVVHAISNEINAPLFCYQVSGEYVMLQSLAKQSAQNVVPFLIESLLSCKRAGAYGILTYAAVEVATFLS